MELTPEDLTHLRRCVDLAREALADGDEPFGSVLVDPEGEVLCKDLRTLRIFAGSSPRVIDVDITLAAVQPVPLGFEHVLVIALE